MIRVGQGYDVHRFNEGEFIILGGVKIDYEQGLEAHSDGDVVLHALSDALLGAAALGCLLYTSPSPRDRTRSRMPSSA